MLPCPHCEETKDDDDFYRQPRNTGRRGRSSWCKTCTKAQNAERKRQHPELNKTDPEYAREYARRQRARAVALYGSCCQRCGFDRDECLDFDHVEGNGRHDRKRRSYYTQLKAIIDGEAGWQLLCANCHRIKTHESGDYRHER
jgi:hypothetical protein